MLHLPPETHPIWRLATLVVVLVFVTLFSSLNCSNFDSGEVKTILFTVMGMAGWGELKSKIAKPQPNEE